MDRVAHSSGGGCEMRRQNRKAAGAGERRAALETDYDSIVADNADSDKIPIEDATIQYLIGRFPMRLAISVFALKAKQINLLDQGCTCCGNGACPVCRAWQSTMRLNAERRQAK